MKETDILLPLPTGGRNADDMGMPPTQPICPEGYYCQCEAIATPEELDWNKCSACGGQLW